MLVLTVLLAQAPADATWPARVRSDNYLNAGDERSDVRVLRPSIPPWAINSVDLWRVRVEKSTEGATLFVRLRKPALDASYSQNIFLNFEEDVELGQVLIFTDERTVRQVKTTPSDFLDCRSRLRRGRDAHTLVVELKRRCMPTGRVTYDVFAYTTSIKGGRHVVHSVDRVPPRTVVIN